VGSGVLASAVGQDKEYMKRVFASLVSRVPRANCRLRRWVMELASGHSITLRASGTQSAERVCASGTNSGADFDWGVESSGLSWGLG
ncbi:hypothetical protein ABZ376_20365, partial [Streptomyces massasporeus]